jgi:speckle-type POZ protein
MTDGARVEAAPRLAQWRVDALPCYTYRKSLPFRIGLWNWCVPAAR